MTNLFVKFGIDDADRRRAANTTPANRGRRRSIRTATIGVVNHTNEAPAGPTFGLRRRVKFAVAGLAGLAGIGGKPPAMAHLRFTPTRLRDRT